MNGKNCLDWLNQGITNSQTQHTASSSDKGSYSARYIVKQFILE